MSGRMNELGFYTLAGAPKSPRELVDEMVRGEELGFGSAFISERWNVKEALTLSGAAAAVTSEIGIGTGATNHNTRHPIITASHATTMHRMTGGRFMLGIGRGIKPLFDVYGIPTITTAQMEDFAGLMRRLWRGEMIVGHDGPAGRYPFLYLDSSFREDIPIGITAFAKNTLELAGRAFDAVILHTFFTDETLVRCVKTVKESAERAGRDPADVRVWSVYLTVGDHLPEALRLKKTVGRLATYLQGYGNLMVKTNRWDPAPLERFRQDSVVAGFRGALDDKATTEELLHVQKLLPPGWLEPAATGSPARCVERIQRQLDLGADGVILHGGTPDELAPIVAAYRAARPAGRFDHLAANPGARPPSRA
jgi:probable F420-dependent oxidoreductase